MTGLPPGERVELSVRPADTGLDTYGWQREYIADAEGRVETGVGTNDGTDETGSRMILSTLDSDEETTGPFTLGDRGAVDLRVRLHVDRHVSAEATTTRVARHPATRGRSVGSSDLAGTVYEPSAEGPHPPVVVLHGSAGVVPEDFCRMLATQGFWTLGLRYFGSPDPVPDELRDVPLSYFERAVAWTESHPETTGEGVGLVGVSRGVEPALLTAVERDGPATVVGYGGAGWIAPGVEPGEPVPWTRDGDPLVSLETVEAFWTAYGEADCDPADCSFDDPHRPCAAVACAVAHVSATEPAAAESVTIPVERVDGPVTLLTGRDDEVWNAPTFSEIALTQVGPDREQAVAHYVSDEAGHRFLQPYYPHVLRGGTREGTAEAAVASWLRTLDTLDAGLR
ncbi:acyl-CoA thioester hydrolase/BAAT C-terminal domain-containing protein [Salinirubrum litoreum]|uniref:Acyl-CoA thioester hydrolase/BAAT C-terminal domain-containing protein n=1 Tax=Salinirubrum litoreum TaxID=1126234 RepID=A0ABD5RG88_9EURY